MRAPKQSHLEAALGVVKYVKQALVLGVLMSFHDSKSFQGFCDAN